MTIKNPFTKSEKKFSIIPFEDEEKRQASDMIEFEKALLFRNKLHKEVLSDILEKSKEIDEQIKVYNQVKNLSLINGLGGWQS